MRADAVTDRVRWLGGTGDGTVLLAKQPTTRTANYSVIFAATKVISYYITVTYTVI